MTKSTGTSLSGAARPETDGAERSLAWWRVAIVLAAVLPLTILGIAAWVTHRDAGREAQRRLDEIAKSAEEHAARVMDRNDVVMQQVLELLKDDDDASIRAREAELHGVAMAILQRFRDIRSLSVWSRDGRLLVSTLFFPVPHKIQRVDWDYFRPGQGMASAGTLTRGIVVDYASGERLYRSTKLRRQGGETGGEVELAFSPSSFNDPFRRLIEGKTGHTLSLVSADGYVIGQWPSSAIGTLMVRDESRLLQRVASGEARGTLGDDVFATGDGHFAAFRKVRDHALFVAAVEGPDSVFAQWKRHMFMLGAILLPITLALVIVAGVVLLRTRREIEARRRLTEESRQRQLAEESLRHAQRLDALGQLAGGLAHDFNNLLAIVSSSAELLPKVVPGAAGRPELLSIERAAQRGTRLTRRLLAFFRRQALEPELVCVGETLEEVRELLRTTAGRGIVLNIDVPADTPAIKVDAAELEIALINLVANARDAMRGTGRIDIKTRPAPSADGTVAAPDVVISVTDNGEGMSPETLSHAFEPFFTTKPAGSGTGLGLSQVAAFCEQSGGSVKVTSELRVGTTVSIVLPAAAQETRSLCARVILVQRDGDTSSSLALMLKQRGCMVTRVASAQDAERLIAAERPHFDAVLADASSEPETTPWITKLRRAKSKVPVVLIRGPAGGAVDTQHAIDALSKAISAHRPATPVH